MHLRHVIFGLALALAAAGRLRADVVYTYVTDQASYSAAPGSDVSVNIYLMETLSGGSTSIINAHNGLFSAGAAVNVSSTTGGSAARVVNNGFTFNSATEPNGFTGPTSAAYNQGSGAAANNLEFLEAVGTSAAQSNNGVTAPANGLVFLGRATIQAGTGTTTYVLTSLHNDTINNSNSQLGQGNNNTVTLPGPLHGGLDLDVTHPGQYTGANDAPPYTFTVVAVPEPSPLLLVAVVIPAAAGCMLSRRWRGHGH
jgi:hypothetical protein